MNLFFILFSALLHPVHETVAEVEWNADTNRIEVALRLDALDEQWLAKKIASGDRQIEMGSPLPPQEISSLVDRIGPEEARSRSVALSLGRQQIRRQPRVVVLRD